MRRLIQEFCLELSDLLSDSARYHELLTAVSKKYPGENRHSTALRYIQQAEIEYGESTKEKVSE